MGHLSLLLSTANAPLPPPLGFVRRLLFCALIVFGLFSLRAAFKQKNFHWRGGGPMPLWFGRVMSVLAGLFFIGSAIYLWNLR